MQPTKFSAKSAYKFYKDPYSEKKKIIIKGRKTL